jgi:soluble lytic murein transglycosylase-like protein
MKMKILAIIAILYPLSVSIESEDSIMKQIGAAASKHGVPACLVYAVAKKESGLRPWVVTYEKRVRDSSFGVMQVRWNTATKELGFKGSKTDLLNLSDNLMIGSKYLAKKIKRYRSLERGVAAYNAGSVGKTIRNKKYVNNIMGLYKDCEARKVR